MQPVLLITFKDPGWKLGKAHRKARDELQVFVVQENFLSRQHAFPLIWGGRNCVQGHFFHSRGGWAVLMLTDGDLAMEWLGEMSLVGFGASGDGGVIPVRMCRVTLFLSWGSCSSRTCLHPPDTIHCMNSLGWPFPTRLWRATGETAGVTPHCWEQGNPVEWAKANCKIPVEGVLWSFCFHRPGRKHSPCCPFHNRQTSGNQTLSNQMAIWCGFRNLGS